MPRNSANVYAPPAGTEAVPGETIASAKYNLVIQDITSDMNAPRPISAGGTGASSASAARVNLGLSPGVGLITSGGVLSLGTPSSITANSTNSASGNTHTHRIAPADIGILSARVGIGAIGTTALMRQTGSSTQYRPGDARAGSGLLYASCSGEVDPTNAPAGTWQAISFVGTSDAVTQTGLWQRVL